MKNLFTLFFALVICPFIGYAQVYTIKGATSSLIKEGTTFSATEGSVIIKSNSDANDTGKTITDVNFSFSDGTKATDIGTTPIRFQIDTKPSKDANIEGSENGKAKENATTFRVTVSKKLAKMYVYYTGATGNRKIGLYDINNDRELNSDGFVGVQSDNAIGANTTDRGFVALVESVSVGEYTLYCDGFGGGFIGVKYSLDVFDEETTLQPISEATTWDFSKVTGFVFNESEKGSYKLDDKSKYYVYSALKKDGFLDYDKTEFNGSALEFSGLYPIRDNEYTQDGSLRFKTTVPGAVKVEFSETGNSSANPTRRYLVVNGERTKYWVSRESTTDDNHLVQMNTKSNWITVPAGDVTIGSTESVKISKLEFMPFGENDGFIEDSFTTRLISGNGTVSTWTYEGYDNGVHGLVGGVSDNGIWHYSGTDGTSSNTNANGNIKFSIDNDTSHSYSNYLTCMGGSSIYIPVPENSYGSIEMIATQEAEDRTFTLYNGNSPVRRNGSEVTLQMKEDGHSINFNSGDITKEDYPNNDENNYISGSYLKLVDNGTSNTPLKVLSFIVTIDPSCSSKYQYAESVEDSDHQILGKHEHAIFSLNDGVLMQPGISDHSHSTLTLDTNFVLDGQGSPSDKTDPIMSFNGGDLVVYKGKYYGTLQLRTGQNFTLTAPDGYYITTSVRVHGYTNDDTRGAEELTNKSAVTDMYGGEFSDALLDYSRDNVGANTTTLDFEVTAEKEISFQFGNVQFLGVIDAVYVKEDAIPSVVTSEGSNSCYLKYERGNEEPVYLTDGMYAITKGGTLTFNRPDNSKELWWYFRKSTAETGKRGAMVEEDDNDYKTFSVKNYPFVNVGGEISTDDLDDSFYVERDYYRAKSNVKMRSAAVGDELVLDVKEDGYLYFYIKDNNTGFNSVLYSSGFGTTTGIEEIEIDNVVVGAEDDSNAPVYNVYGQRVNEAYRGVVIKNGRKYVQK